MKISAVRLFVLEAPELPIHNHLKLAPVPNLLRLQIKQTLVPSGQPLRQNFIQVETDDGREHLALAGIAVTDKQISELIEALVGQEALNLDSVHVMNLEELASFTADLQPMPTIVESKPVGPAKLKAKKVV